MTRGGRALLARDRGRTSFALPGGGVQDGELPICAVARELREETTLAATAIAYRGEHSGKYNHHHIFSVAADGDVDVAQDDMVEEFAWWDGAADVPVHPHVREIRQGSGGFRALSRFTRMCARYWAHTGTGRRAAASYQGAYQGDYRAAGMARHPNGREIAHGRRIRHRATLVVTREGRLLLVREPGDAEFYLPGGGVERGELPICAAARELHEETGMTALSIRHLFDHCDFWGGRRSDFWKSSSEYWGQAQSVFGVEAQGAVRLSAEHAEYMWWDGAVDAPLPDDIAPLLRMIGGDWQTNNGAGGGEWQTQDRR